MTETTEQTRKCSNCMWWESPINDWHKGICRGAPPTMGTHDFVWPVTTGIDWCGSFRMKEPGQ